MSTSKGRPPRALSIAGSDSSGGAGVQADVTTFAALGVFATAAVSAITVQDSRGVHAVSAVAPRLVRAQIETVLGDLGADAVKTGMLCSRAIVASVAAALERFRIAKLVVDPVIRSTSGAELLDRRGVQALCDSLLPLACVVTPNLAEAAVLANMEVHDGTSAEEACRRILRLGARSVVVTGGHLAGDPVDFIADRRGIRRITGRRIGAGAHGTGCVFSAALAAHLARGSGLDEAVRAAKHFVEARLRGAAQLGGGRMHLGLFGSGSSRRRRR
jgi:hydroxymethylpyrimidine/phosphomethylpyrimidine kinase